MTASADDDRVFRVSSYHGDIPQLLWQAGIKENHHKLVDKRHEGCSGPR
jgi:hypothetical protein